MHAVPLGPKSEVEERLSLGDPFVTGVFKEGKVLYG